MDRKQIAELIALLEMAKDNLEYNTVFPDGQKISNRDYLNKMAVVYAKSQIATALTLLMVCAEEGSNE